LPARRDRQLALNTATQGCLSAARLCLATLCLLLSSGPAHAATGDASNEGRADETTIGTRLGANLTVGGWATLGLDLPRAGSAESASVGTAHEHGDDDPQHARRARLGVRHLSGMLWWEPSPSLKLLAEVDRQNALQLPAYRDIDDGSASAPFLTLERLYLDLRADDALGLRIGKFLTPIGRWNLNHADPLTWTTLRPLISRSAFPTYASGVLLFGDLAIASQGIEYQVFASDDLDWRTSPQTSSFGRAAGARVVLHATADLQIGLSLARFERRESQPVQSRLDSADLRWTWRGVELSGEALSRRSPAQDDSGERGAYLQAAVPMVAGWYATTRVEVYKRSEDPLATRSALVGVVYRNARHCVIKAEWVRPSGGAAGLPQGLLASMTMLF
jgi:hypothetical protein